MNLKRLPKKLLQKPRKLCITLIQKITASHAILFYIAIATVNKNLSDFPTNGEGD